MLAARENQNREMENRNVAKSSHNVQNSRETGTNTNIFFNRSEICRILPEILKQGIKRRFIAHSAREHRRSKDRELIFSSKERF